jgi:hypothetical protein
MRPLHVGSRIASEPGKANPGAGGERHTSSRLVREPGRGAESFGDLSDGTNRVAVSSDLPIDVLAPRVASLRPFERTGRPAAASAVGTGSGRLTPWAIRPPSPSSPG